MKSFKKQILGTALSAALLVSAVAPAAFAEDETVTLPEHGDVFVENTHKAIMAGYDTGEFGIGDNMTRGQAIQIIYNEIQGNEDEYDETVSTTPTFTDVDTSKHYYKAVGYLEHVGIVTGYGDGTVGAEDYITRVQLLTLLDKYIANGADGVIGDIFSDVDEDTAGYNFIRNAAASGWVAGYGDGTFGPTDLVTREQATAIFVQALERNDAFVPDADDEDAKTFSDVENKWYYNHVMEATNEHSTYDNIYASVLRRYLRAAESGFEVYDQSTVEATMVKAGNADIGYTYQDIDGDGRTELVIGTSKDDVFTIYDIYSYDDDGTVARYAGIFGFNSVVTDEDSGITVDMTTYYQMDANDGTWSVVNMVMAVSDGITTVYSTYELDAEDNIVVVDGVPVLKTLTDEDEYDTIIAKYPAAFSGSVVVLEIGGYDQDTYTATEDETEDDNVIEGGALQVTGAVVGALGA